MIYGFTQSLIDSTHWVFGSMPKVVIQPDGQYDEFLPVYEPQYLKDGTETDGCTIWGTEHCVETIMRRKFGFDANYSERFPYILVPIHPPGSDPHTVAEKMRKAGFIDESYLPIPDTYAEFIQPDPMSNIFLLKGQQWLSEYSFNHEWVFSSLINKSARQALMKEALLYSPLGISVTAWIENDGVYVDNGQPNNHWCMCFGWTDKGWKVFDSYEQTVKIVSFDHQISCCKRYSIDKKGGESFIWRVLKWLVTVL